MKLSELIKNGYLEDTKKEYVIKKNFRLLDLSGTLDKPLIIPKNPEFDLSTPDYCYELQEFFYSGKGPLFVSEELL